MKQMTQDFNDSFQIYQLMQEQQKVAIENHFLSLNQEASPQKLSQADAVIIVVTGSEQESGELFKRFHKLESRDEALIKAGLPRFRIHGQHSLIGDFGKYFLTPTKQSSYQSIFNLFYTLRGASKVKFILEIQEEKLNKAQNIFTFLVSLIRTFEEYPNLDNLFDTLFDSVGLYISGPKTEQIYLKQLLKFSKTIQMNDDQQIRLKNLLNKIIEKKHVITKSLTPNSIVEKINAVQPFTFTKHTLESFFSEKLRANSSVQKLVNSALVHLSEETQTIMKKVEEKLDLVFHEDSNVVEKELEMIAAAIKTKKDFKRMIDSKMEAQNIVYLRIINVLRDLLIMNIQDKEEKSPVSRALELIFRRRAKYSMNFDSDLKLFGICAFSALLHNVFPQLKGTQQLMFQQKETVQNMTDQIIQQFNLLLFEWAQKSKTFYPMQASQMLMILNQTSNFVLQINKLYKEFPDKQSQTIKYNLNNTEIGIIRLKYVYFRMVEKHMNNHERLSFVIEWEKSLRKVVVSDNLNLDDPTIGFIVKKIYDVIGSYLMARENFYYAIKLYSSVFLTDKLITACHEYLSRNIHSIQVDQFKEIFLILHNNGMVEKVRQQLYKKLELIDNDEKDEIRELLLSSVTNEEGNCEIYMQDIKNGKILTVKLLDQSTMEAVINEIHRQLNKQEDVLILDFKQ